MKVHEDSQSPPPVQVIINGDDCGFSPSINRGIIQSITQGILTSVSLMANGAAFEGAIDFLREHPEISVGWHINLTSGMPVTPGAGMTAQQPS